LICADNSAAIKWPSTFRNSPRSNELWNGAALVARPSFSVRSCHACCGKIAPVYAQRRDRERARQYFRRVKACDECPGEAANPQSPRMPRRARRIRATHDQKSSASSHTRTANAARPTLPMPAPAVSSAAASVPRRNPCSSRFSIRVALAAKDCRESEEQAADIRPPEVGNRAWNRRRRSSQSKPQEIFIPAALAQRRPFGTRHHGAATRSCSPPRAIASHRTSVRLVAASADHRNLINSWADSGAVKRERNGAQHHRAAFEADIGGTFRRGAKQPAKLFGRSSRPKSRK
jgi:hypothetical protein